MCNVLEEMMKMCEDLWVQRLLLITARGALLQYFVDTLLWLMLTSNGSAEIVSDKHLIASHSITGTRIYTIKSLCTQAQLFPSVQCVAERICAYIKSTKWQDPTEHAGRTRVGRCFVLLRCFGLRLCAAAAYAVLATASAIVRERCVRALLYQLI